MVRAADLQTVEQTGGQEMEVVEMKILKTSTRKYLNGTGF